MPDTLVSTTVPDSASVLPVIPVMGAGSQAHESTSSPVVQRIFIPTSQKRMPKMPRYRLEDSFNLRADTNYRSLTADSVVSASTAAIHPWKAGIAETPRQTDHIASSAIILLMTVIFCIIAVNFLKFVKIIGSYIEELRSRRSRANVFDEPTVNERSISLVLTLQFVVCAAMMLYASVTPAGEPVSDTGLPVIGGLALLVGAYYVFQLVAYSAVGYAFSSPGMCGKWIRVFIATQNLAGVCALIPVLLAVFYPACSRTMAIISLVAYLIARILFISKGFRIFYHNFYSLLYFILYLCALEIIPPFLVYRCARLIHTVI